MYNCCFCERKFTTKPGLGNHKRSCNLNPDRNPKKYSKPIWNKGLTKETSESIRKGSEKYKENLKAGKFLPSFTGRTLTEEHKQKISVAMKEAHNNGTAWNIGMSRWNNTPSYPEIFFAKVIENEFSDKEYLSEFNVGIFSIDFAWVNKKKAIEIDGEQHYRFKEIIERDKRKNKYLELNGWEIHRIRWKDLYANSKFHIKEAKQFIGD